MENEEMIANSIHESAVATDKLAKIALDSSIKQSKKTRRTLWGMIAVVVIFIGVGIANIQATLESRHTAFIIADCTTPPGLDPNVPGECYKRAKEQADANRAATIQAINEAIKHNADQVQCNISPKNCKPGFTPETN